MIETLEGMASLAVALWSSPRRQRLWGAAEAARGVTGIAFLTRRVGAARAYLAAARSRLGGRWEEKALAEGQASRSKRQPRAPLQGRATRCAHGNCSGGTLALPTIRCPDSSGEEVALAAAGAYQPPDRLCAHALRAHRATHIRNVLKKLGLVSKTRSLPGSESTNQCRRHRAFLAQMG